MWEKLEKRRASVIKYLMVKKVRVMIPIVPFTESDMKWKYRHGWISV